MEKFIGSLSVLLLVVLSYSLSAQTKYWVYLDKKKVDSSRQYVSNAAIANRQMLGLPLIQASDAPVDQQYIDSLQSMGIMVVNRSRWLNAVAVYAAPSQMAMIGKQDFVRGFGPVKTDIYQAAADSSINSSSYRNYAMEQMHAGMLAEQQLDGKGVVIGLIDGNFYRADRNKGLTRVFEEKKILGTRDFVDPGSQDFFNSSRRPGDMHGHFVLLHVAGFDPEKLIGFGPASGSTFYLARTEDPFKETRKEEDNWIAALEWLDSLGVRLVNSSLGYNTDFDDPKENHMPAEMNGRTTALSKAAEMAIKEKGMIIVSAAGTIDDKNNWQVVSAPADAPDVITVGATDMYWEKPSWSATGPDFNNYLKPDVSCFSDKGNSFSAPVITGLIACLLQQHPNLRASQIKEMLQRSGHLYPYGNNYLGYGVPDIGRVLQLSNSKGKNAGAAKQVRAHGNEVQLDAPDQEKGNTAVLFHKKDERIVLQQELITAADGKFTVKRGKDAARTTISIRDKVTEIIW